LQTAGRHEALLPQETKVCEEVCVARGEWRDGRFALLPLDPSAEIKPALQLAGVALPRGRTAARKEELKRHLLAREVVGQLA
jgi:hypothetical protein